MGGSNPQYYTSQGGQSLVGTPQNLQQLLASLSAAAPAPTSTSQAGSGSSGSGGLMNQQHQGGGLIGQAGLGGDVKGGMGSVMANSTPGDVAHQMAGSNMAATPSAMNSARLAGGILTGGMNAPFGLMGDAVSSLLGFNGLMGSPLDTPGSFLSPEAMSSILSSVAGLPPNAPTVTVMNAVNNAINAARSQSARAIPSQLATSTTGPMAYNNAVGMQGLAAQGGHQGQPGGPGPGLSAGVGANGQGTNIGGAGVSHNAAGGGGRSGGPSGAPGTNNGASGGGGYGSSNNASGLGSRDN